MRNLLIAILLSLSAFGCIGSDSSSPTSVFNRVNEDGISGHALCPETSVIAATIFAKQYGWDNVRIMYGPTGEPWTHVQAQFRTDADQPWQWIQTSRIIVEAGAQDNFTPTIEYSVDEVWEHIRNDRW